MIVICEECGKKYRVNPETLKGKEATFRCRACNHGIRVLRPEAMSIAQDAGSVSRDVAPGPDPGETPPAPPKGLEDVCEAVPVRMGLRARMALLFFLVPIAVIVASGLLYLRQINALSGLITEESSKMVTDFAERIIEEKARSVAAQVAIYLQGRQGQESKREPLSADPVFKKISVQKVGLTGYTALYERPGSDGIWRTWAHVNPAIIGIDMSTLSKTLGRNFPGFWNVYTRVQGGKESRGYYTWQDKDGTFREKFMVCTPVEGTPFVIAATTYLDEFTKDVKNLQGQSDAVTRGTRHMTFAILGATLLLIGGIVSLYGHALTKRIKDMTRIAERISVGDLEAEIRTGSRDEIGALGEAISRMQESIRLSLERLRRAR
jgi:predicted Zn finger-like uncharacterized protein